MFVFRPPHGTTFRGDRQGVRSFEKISRSAGSRTRAHAGCPNAADETVNDLITRIERAAFGFRIFADCRIRVLLYAGKLDWDLLPALSS